MTSNSNQLTIATPVTDIVTERLDTSKHLQAIGRDATAAALVPVVYTAGVIRGADLNEDAQRIMASALALQLLEDFPTLTMTEVALAIRQGSFGKYGEVYGVNPASLYAMVRAYTESEEKAEITRRVREARERRQAEDRRRNEQFRDQHADIYRTRVTYEEYKAMQAAKQQQQNTTTI